MNHHSPDLFPLISNHMNSPDARIDNYVENILRMVSLLKTFTIIHRFYLVKLTLDEYFASLGSLPH